MHFHAYTSETIAEARLYGTKQLSVIPGVAEAYAQLNQIYRNLMLLLPGDRFIIRQFSPVVTIGGGLVLDASPVLVAVQTARQRCHRLCFRSCAMVHRSKLVPDSA